MMEQCKINPSETQTTPTTFEPHTQRRRRRRTNATNTTPEGEKEHIRKSPDYASDSQPPQAPVHQTPMNSPLDEYDDAQPRKFSKSIRISRS